MLFAVESLRTLTKFSARSTLITKALVPMDSFSGIPLGAEFCSRVGAGQQYREPEERQVLEDAWLPR